MKKKTRKAIRQMIKLLRAITEGQGSVCIDIFDAGAGGGWVSGRMKIYLERDGDIGTIESYESAKEFVTAIESMMEEHHDGLMVRRFENKR